MAKMTATEISARLDRIAKARANVAHEDLALFDEMNDTNNLGRCDCETCSVDLPTPSEWFASLNERTARKTKADQLLEDIASSWMDDGKETK